MIDTSSIGNLLDSLLLIEIKEFLIIYFFAYILSSFIRNSLGLHNLKDIKGISFSKKFALSMVIFYLAINIVSLLPESYIKSPFEKSTVIVYILFAIIMNTYVLIRWRRFQSLYSKIFLYSANFVAGINNTFYKKEIRKITKPQVEYLLESLDKEVTSEHITYHLPSFLISGILILNSFSYSPLFIYLVLCLCLYFIFSEYWYEYTKTKNTKWMTEGLGYRIKNFK